MINDSKKIAKQFHTMPNFSYHFHTIIGKPNNVEEQKVYVKFRRWGNECKEQKVCD